jgi:hypothetical protein
MEDLGLVGFAVVEAADFGIAAVWDREAEDAGYRRPE